MGSAKAPVLREPKMQQHKKLTLERLVQYWGQYQEEASRMGWTDHETEYQFGMWLKDQGDYT